MLLDSLVWLVKGDLAVSEKDNRNEIMIRDMSRFSLAGRADSTRETVTITDFSTCEPSAFVSPQPQHPGAAAHTHGEI